ncbi:Peptidyl-prolyl cis-trans isomerase fkbp1a [Nucella lapillus]
MGVEIEPIASGDGTNYPQKGQTVVVHYTGTLTNKKQFDSSRDRDKPFKFKLGLGQVIKGWDDGVAKMSKGERAKLTISSDLAYGKSGSQALFVLDRLTIPPNSTLIFDVELLDFY